MSNKAIQIIAMVLCGSTLCFAVIDQEQIFQLDANNNLQLVGDGLQIGSNFNLVGTSDLQQATTVNGMVTFLQYEDTTYFQTAVAVGESGAFGVEQLGQGIGSQNQHQGGGVGLGDQNQALNADLAQNLVALGPSGYVGGVHGFYGVQLQAMSTPWAMSLNISKLGVVDIGSIRQNPAQY